MFIKCKERERKNTLHIWVGECTHAWTPAISFYIIPEWACVVLVVTLPMSRLILCVHESVQCRRVEAAGASVPVVLGSWRWRWWTRGTEGWGVTSRKPSCGSPFITWDQFCHECSPGASDLWLSGNALAYPEMTLLGTLNDKVLEEKWWQKKRGKK